MREQFGATGSLERSMTREVIEREREDGTYIESHGVDALMMWMGRRSHAAGRVASVRGEGLGKCTVTAQVM